MQTNDEFFRKNMIGQQSRYFNKILFPLPQLPVYFLPGHLRPSFKVMQVLECQGSFVLIIHVNAEKSPVVSWMGDQYKLT